MKKSVCLISDIILPCLLIACLPSFLFADSIPVNKNAGAQGVGCVVPQTKRVPPELDIYGSVTSDKLRHDLPLSEIRTLEKEKGYPNAHQVLGFTSCEMKTGLSLTLQFLDKGQGNGCAWLKSLDVSFDVTLLQVFIPSGYDTHSCEYKTVLEHEEEHVKILNDTHEEFLKVLRQMLETPGALSDSQAPITALSADSAKATIENNVKRMLDDFMKDFSETLTKKQQTIDTEENYRRVLAKCPEWR